MYKYDINYIYVFSDEIEFDRIDVPSGDDYKVIGFKEEQSPFFIGAMVNDSKYSYAHKFKCKETLYLKTNQKDGDKDMQMEYKEVRRECEYISLICGLEGDF